MTTDTLTLDSHTGVVVTGQQIEAATSEYIEKEAVKVEEQRWNSLSLLMASLRGDERLRWANALDMKNAVEKALEANFGPRNKQSAPAKPVKEAKAKDLKRPEAAPIEADPNAMFKEGFLSKLHKPGGNPQIKPELKQQHLAATGGRVMTRFPPEPNGFLHIGHSKAIAVDFGFARYHNGLCYLRYDDTNPAAEEEQYFESILETVRWLGYEPFKITYSSDYFDQLYELAVRLIKCNKAYVDHSTSEEIAAGRGGKERGPRKANKYRDRPIEESLRDFEDMKNGKYKQGTVTLRMKQDLEGSGNPQMWDLIAYRVLDAKHHRTGDKWCIYPTYDFTHCLVDSFENISHSLCTTEFILSRESYEWLCDALEVYKPRQYEFGRLNLEGTITSKRKILKLVREGYVQDWDDPRLYTLLALRRRGIPPGAILSFVNQLGVTTATTSIEGKRLDQTVRQYLETSTPRLMMLLTPLRIVLENVPEDYLIELERPLHPKEPSMGKAKVPFCKEVYIDSTDFRTEDAPDYYRLAPGKTVGLLNVPFPVTCTSFVRSTNGGVDHIVCRYEDPKLGGETSRKAKTYIQWVAKHVPSFSPVLIDEVRLFRPLFKVANPAAEDNYLDHVDRNSMDRVKGAMIEPGFWTVAERAIAEAKAHAEQRTKEATVHVAKDRKGDSKGAPDRTSKQLYGNEVVRFQAMRIAYFCLDNRDADLHNKKIILNRIVSLKEDAGKTKATS